jgi:predicted amidophosphoribosyltransferase
MTCKGVCIRHKALGRYTDGHKRCKSCDVFIKWEGLRCPCCGYQLRTGPRYFRYKAKLREQKQVEVKYYTIISRTPKENREKRVICHQTKNNK